MAITVTAGSRLTAAVYNTNIPYYVASASDQALTTTPAAWNGGTLSFAAAGIYECRVYLDYSVSVAANDFRTVWTTPTGGATQGRLMTIGAGTGSTGAPSNATDGGFQSRVPTAVVSFSGGTSTTVRGCAYQSFVVTTTTAGTLSVNVYVSAGTGTLYAGSYFVAHRVS